MRAWRNSWGTETFIGADHRYVRDGAGVWLYGKWRAEFAGLRVVGAVDLVTDARVVGLRAPELSGIIYTRMLAEAERDVRVARRRLRETAERRKRITAALSAAGATRGQLSPLLGVTRERVQQLVAAKQVTSSVGEPVSRAMLRDADARWRESSEQLQAALQKRRERVLTASAHFQMGLGEIADVLGISRTRAQQLRDDARKP